MSDLLGRTTYTVAKYKSATFPWCVANREHNIYGCYSTEKRALEMARTLNDRESYRGQLGRKN